MSRSLSVTLVAVLLVGMAFGQGLTGVVDSARPSPATGDTATVPAEAVGPPLTVATQNGFAQSTFEIEVFANGSARWTFRFVRPLANDSEREQFQTFADRFESTETDFYRTYRQRSIALTNAASNTTGREMAARNFSRSARVVPPGNRGIVEISFLWTNLGVVNGDRVRVADVFDGGFYIADDQWLVFATGPGLAFDPARTEPAPDEFSGDTLADSETLTWIGQQQFTDKHPRIVLAPEAQVTTTGQGAGAGTTATAGTATTNGSNGAGGDGGGGDSFPMLLFGLVVLVIGLGAGAAWRSGAFGSDSTTDDGGGTASAESTSQDATGAEAAAGAGAAAESTEPAVPDEELLTDEDRVIQMLEASGGRMKQANIVDETGWSKSKVSMLLSDMEEEGDISKLWVGRENIVSLKGHEPDDSGSPFDDED